jgi:hypothetical protein
VVVVHSLGHLNPWGIRGNRFTAALSTLGFGGGEARLGSFLNQPPLELRIDPGY